MLKVPALIGMESPLWKESARENVVPFTDTWIACGTEFAAIAWIPFVVAEPVAAG